MRGIYEASTRHLRGIYEASCLLPVLSCGFAGSSGNRIGSERGSEARPYVGVTSALSASNDEVTMVWGALWNGVLRQLGTWRCDLGIR
jgi:hypothetical protein